VLAKYDKIIKALMASLALYRGIRGKMPKYSECFTAILNQADALGQLDYMKRSLFDSFNECENIKQIS